ncbi:biotin synthase, mitochondrial-like [Mangifera indica]|uniref:biotin synthase, mitochondrial-like n=1 Tax=Mangifera indica TaxID=29780 RepID=UPI001CFABD2E|nr:biotin synthase, mitochondrial-like [Mangifera indica]
MGAAWTDTIGRKTNFNNILEYVKEIREMGMEVCYTLGMLEKQQALELKKAGLIGYNHNHDTSKEYYPNVITTRSYDECMETLKHVCEAGINACSGDLVLKFEFGIFLNILYAKIFYLDMSSGLNS